MNKFESCKQAIEFNHVIHADLHSIVNPFLTALSITQFGYQKIFKDCSRFFISTNKSWFHEYVKADLISDHNHIKLIPNQKGIVQHSWSVQPTDTVFQHLFQHIKSGFTIFDRQEEYVDAYYFASNITTSPNIYINNLNSLKAFIFYFKTFLKNIDENKNQCIIQPNEQYNLPTLAKENINNNMPLPKALHLGKYYLDENDIYLTHRELECILNIANGLSSKEIAQEMIISTKTVEYHVNSLKSKFNLFSKHQLKNKIMKDVTRWLIH